MSTSADRSMELAYSPAAKTSAPAGERPVAVALRPAIPSLTGLRFIAAFAVLIGHAMHWVAPISPDYSVIRLLGEASGLGMPLFFVLSGFVIHYNYGHYFKQAMLPAFTRFMIARFARLYPLYLALLLIYFWERGLNFFEVDYIGRYLTLTQAWQLLYDGPTWVGHLYLAPAWSISVEWFLYIFYGLVTVHLLQFKTVRGCMLAFAAVAAIYYAGVVVAFQYHDLLNDWALTAYAADVRPQHALFGWIFNTGPIGRCFEFTLGMLSAQLFLLRGPLDQAQRQAVRWLMYGALLVVAFIYVNPFGSRLISFGFYMASFSSPFIAFILYACACAPSGFASVMGSRPAVALGDASYSIYLLHALVLPMFAMTAAVAEPSWAWAGRVTLGIATVLLLSLLTYRFYEAPTRRWLRYALGALWKRYLAGRSERLGDRLMSPAHGTLAIVFAITFLWVNRPDVVAKIEIIEASYGANQKDTIPPPPFPNTFKPGNATMAVRQECLHRQWECEYTVSLVRIGGDPVHGAPKDYSVDYRCPYGQRTRHFYLPGEAHGQTALLSCR